MNPGVLVKARLLAALLGAFVAASAHAHQFLRDVRQRKPDPPGGQGRRIRIQQNPHVYIELEARDPRNPKGKPQYWSIECANPGILNRLGWKFNMIKRTTGMTIVVAPLRTKEPGALLKQIKLPDGRVFGNGRTPRPAEHQHRGWQETGGSQAVSHALATALLATALATAGCAPKQSEPTAAAKPAFDAKDLKQHLGSLPAAHRELWPGSHRGATARADSAVGSPAWEAEQKKINEANAAGEPIATGYTHCIPDGMPAMMMAMFPMEVLQTPRQTAVVQEAYNQVRRIYLNDTLPAVEDAEPGFWGHSTGKWEGNDFVVETMASRSTCASATRRTRPPCASTSACA